MTISFVSGGKTPWKLVHEMVTLKITLNMTETGNGNKILLRNLNKTDLSGHVGMERKILLKWILRKQGLDSSTSEQSPATGSSEHGIEPYTNKIRDARITQHCDAFA